MSQRQVYLLAGAAWCGALLPVAVVGYWWLPVGLVAVMGWRRRLPLVLIVVGLVAGSFGASAAWADIDHVASSAFHGEAVLANDPRPANGGVRVLADIDGRRYDLRAWGASAGHLRGRLLGERILLRANLRASSDAPRWLRAQGIVGQGTVTAFEGFDVGQLHTRMANSIRRTLESGASSLSIDQRSLFSGLVYGDDRRQSPLTADNFQAAGLTHLLAVSGQNVAFVLAVVGPVLRRLERHSRFVLVLAVLLLFATITRFEPSVVRASVMTGVAATASLLGAEVASKRVLGLAVAALIVADPLIVHSVAFQLSVAASAGILFWSGRVARALPGPRVLIETVAVTATAQLAVAPLLIWRFDGLPVASLPANIAAAPMAGPIMMWGLTAGLVAGWMPSALAALLHQPTRVGLWWIDGVAVLARQLPLGLLGAVHVVVLFGLGAAGLRQTGRLRRAAAATAIALVLLQPAVSVATSVPRSMRIGDNSVIWRDHSRTILVLGSRAWPDDVLAALRTANVGGINLVIAQRADFSTASLLGWIEANHDIGTVWAPEPTMGFGEMRPPPGSTFEVGSRVMQVQMLGVELVVSPAPANPP